MNFKHETIEFSFLTLFRRLARLMLLSSSDVAQNAPIVLSEIDQVETAFSDPSIQKRFVDVQIRDRLAHVKQVTLPRSARKKASKILTLQAEAFGKSTNSQMVHQFVRLPSNGVSDIYHQIFARPADITRIKQAATSSNLKVRSIYCLSEGQRAYFEGSETPFGRATFFWWFGGLAIINAALFTSILAMQNSNSELDELLSKSHREISALDTGLTEKQARSTEIDLQKADVIMQISLLADYMKTTQILTGLTEQLPRNAWISNLALNGTDLSISGRTKEDPLLLIDDLDSAVWIKEVGVESPLQRDDYLSETLFDLKLSIDLSQL